MTGADATAEGRAAKASATDDGAGRPAGEAIPRAVGVGLVVAAVALQMVRIRGVGVWDTIWLEDADVYVEQANRDGPLAVLLRAYAGYVQLLPRLLAIPTAWLPVSWLAAYLALAGSTVAALAGAFVYRHLDGWVADRRVRLAIATLTVLGPALAVENTALITNTIWTVLTILPVALLSQRTRPADLVQRGVAIALAATSTALAGLWVPVAVAVVVWRRDRASVAMAAVFGAAFAVQLAVVAGTDLAEREDNSLRVLADFLGLRVLGSFLVGERQLGEIWEGPGEVGVAALVVLFVGLAVLGARGADRPQRGAAAACVSASLGVCAVPLLLRGTSAVGFEPGAYTVNMSRYTVGALLLLAVAVGILVSPGPLVRRVADGPSRARRHVEARGQVAFLAHTALVVVLGFSATTVRSEGPSWAAEVERGWAELCDRRASDEVVRLTTSPDNFSVGLPCHRLEP